MGVKFKQIGGGTPQLLQFSDNFDRANDNGMGADWVRLLGGNNLVTLEAWSTSAIVNNQAVLTGRGENNPNAVLFTAYAPLPVMYSLFDRPSVFAQATFVAAVGVSGGLGLRCNQAHLSTQQTTPDGFDCYICVQNGRLDQMLNGAAQTTIGANTVAIVAGTVFRIEAVNSGTSTTVRTFANGVQVNSVTIPAASFPIQRGYPCFIVTSVSGAPPTGSSFTWDDFSCGVF